LFFPGGPIPLRPGNNWSTKGKGEVRTFRKRGGGKDATKIGGQGDFHVVGRPFIK